MLFSAVRHNVINTSKTVGLKICIRNNVAHYAMRHRKVPICIALYNEQLISKALRYGLC